MKGSNVNVKIESLERNLGIPLLVDKMEHRMLFFSCVSVFALYSMSFKQFHAGKGIGILYKMLNFLHEMVFRSIFIEMCEILIGDEKVLWVKVVKMYTSLKVFAILTFINRLVMIFIKFINTGQDKN